MIQVGTKLDTTLELDIVEGGDSRKVRLEELLEKPTIISVYMRNNTSGCDRQNRDLAEHAEWFQDKGFNLVALSKDTCGSHQKYAEKLGIGYILASDPEHRFAQATDSIVEKKMYGKTFEAPSRSAFVIDTDGSVMGVVEKVDTRGHALQLRELVESL